MWSLWGNTISSSPLISLHYTFIYSSLNEAVIISNYTESVLDYFLFQVCLIAYILLWQNFIKFCFWPYMHTISKLLKWEKWTLLLQSSLEILKHNHNGSNHPPSSFNEQNDKTKRKKFVKLSSFLAILKLNLFKYSGYNWIWNILLSLTLYINIKDHKTNTL